MKKGLHPGKTNECILIRKWELSCRSNAFPTSPKTVTKPAPGKIVKSSPLNNATLKVFFLSLSVSLSSFFLVFLSPSLAWKVINLVSCSGTSRGRASACVCVCACVHVCARVRVRVSVCVWREEKSHLFIWNCLKWVYWKSKTHHFFRRTNYRINYSVITFRQYFSTKQLLSLKMKKAKLCSYK